MVRIGNVWDRTVEVLSGRASILAALATIYFFLPGVVSALVRALGTPEGVAGPEGAWRLIAAIVSIASGVLLLMGLLAVTAVASDPGVNKARANAIAGSRLGKALLVVLVIVAVAVAIFVPAGVLILTSGASIDPVTGQLDMSDASTGRAGLGFLFGFLGLIVGLWLSARLAPLFPVVVNEGMGVGAFARSFALTRGSAMKLIGVIILYSIVTLVVIAAATMVTGTIAGLLLGEAGSRWTPFVVAVVSAAVTAGATVLQAVFYARFYAAAVAATGPVAPAA